MKSGTSSTKLLISDYGACGFQELLTFSYSLLYSCIECKEFKCLNNENYLSLIRAASSINVEKMKFQCKCYSLYL